MSDTAGAQPLIIDGIPVLEVPPRTAAVMKSVSERSILRWIADGKLQVRRLPGGRALRIRVHRVGFWRIQISKDGNRTTITELFVDALTHACTALANQSRDEITAALDAETYLHRFSAATRARIALFDGTRQERIRLRAPEASEVTVPPRPPPAATPLAGTAIDETRDIVADVARRHHSLVTTAEAGRRGVNPQPLRTFVAEGLLHRTNNRGVYTTVPHPLTHLHRLRAAWYAADTRTPMDERANTVREVITGPTALTLHAGKVPAPPYHLALGSKTRQIKRADIIAHRTRPLTKADVTVIRGLSVTTVEATCQLGCGRCPGRRVRLARRRGYLIASTGRCPRTFFTRRIERSACCP